MTNRKLLSMLSAVAINFFILSIAMMLSYQMNEETRLFGIGYPDLYLLLFSLPIITWINFLILQIVKRGWEYELPKQNINGK